MCVRVGRGRDPAPGKLSKIANQNTWTSISHSLPLRLLLEQLVVCMCTQSFPTLCNPIKHSPREGKGTPLQHSCLENPTDEGAWWAAVHGVAKSRTWLSSFPFTFHFHALEKEMATHSSVLAWKIPGTGEPGGLPSMGSHRVVHNWNGLAAAAGRHRLWCSPYMGGKQETMSG